MPDPLHPADTPPTHAVLRRLVSGDPVPEDLFAPAVLSAFPAGAIGAIAARLLRDHGRLERITGSEAQPTLHLARADVPTRIALDAMGRIAGLFFQPPLPHGSLADQVRTIAALPGRTALLVTTGQEVRAAHAPDDVLAVASAFKIAVLRAVRDAVAAGRLAWDIVVRLDPGWRSLPTGILQDWPGGAPLTIATLANLMISLSDNTAADALIHLVGREAIEALSPHDRPVSTTREIFVLSAAANADLRREWAGAVAPSRRALLPRLAALPLPAPDAFAPTRDLTATPGLGWFASATELLDHLRVVADIPALSINTGPVERGPPERRIWRRVAYKGGSLPGVLCLAALMTGRDGRDHTAIAIWNDTEALEAERLIGPFRAIAALLAADSGAPISVR